MKSNQVSHINPLVLFILFSLLAVIFLILPLNLSVTTASSNISVGPESIVGTTLASYNNIEFLDSNHFIFFHSMNTLQTGKVNGNTVNYGAEVPVDNTIGTVTAINSNVFVFAYVKQNSIYARLGQLNGLQISLSSEETKIVDSGVYMEMFSYNLQNENFLICWRTPNASIQCTVGKAQGSQLSFTNIATPVTNENGYELTAARLDSSKFVLAYGTANGGKTVVGSYTMDSGQLSFGANKAYTNLSNVRYPFVISLDNNNILLSYSAYTYQSATNYLSSFLTTASVNGTEINLEITKEVDGQNPSFVVLGKYDSQSFWLGYLNDNSGTRSGIFRPGTIKNGSIDIGNGEVFKNQGFIHLGLGKLSQNNYLIKYWENGKTIEDQKTALVHQVVSTLNSPTNIVSTPPSPIPTPTTTQILLPNPSPTTTSPTSPNKLQGHTQPTTKPIPTLIPSVSPLQTNIPEQNPTYQGTPKITINQPSPTTLTAKSNLNKKPFYRYPLFWKVQLVTVSISLGILFWGYKDILLKIFKKRSRSNP